MKPVDWVRQQGVVLQSAKGPVPNLAEHVAGEPIQRLVVGPSPQPSDLRGARAGRRLARRRRHPADQRPHHADPCRRLWPAVVRLADTFPADRLAEVGEEHTATGAHRRTEVPFPDWVPADVMTGGGRLTAEEAAAQLPECLRPDLPATCRERAASVPAIPPTPSRSTGAGTVGSGWAGPISGWPAPAGSLTGLRRGLRAHLQPNHRSPETSGVPPGRMGHARQTRRTLRT